MHPRVHVFSQGLVPGVSQHRGKRTTSSRATLRRLREVQQGLVESAVAQQVETSGKSSQSPAGFSSFSPL